MLIVSKALLISSATVIVRAGRDSWFCTRAVWVCLVCLLLCKEKCSSTVTAITEEGYGPV